MISASTRLLYQNSTDLNFVNYYGNSLRNPDGFFKHQSYFDLRSMKESESESFAISGLMTNKNDSNYAPRQRMDPREVTQSALFSASFLRHSIINLFGRLNRTHVR